MNKYIKLFFVIITAILIIFICFRDKDSDEVVDETIKKDLNKGYNKRVERVRNSNGRIHIRFIPNNDKIFKIDESLYLNDLTNFIETNDSLVKIPNTNKCILYKKNNTIVRFNYIEYTDEIKKRIEKKINKKIEEWNQNEIGIFTDQLSWTS